MRISSNYHYESLRGQMNKAGDTYKLAQQRVSTGKRLNTLGDDPRGLSDVISMRGIKSALDQYSANLDRGKTWLNTAENSFKEANNLLNRANSLAISGATATATTASRQAMADEVKTIRDQILQLANTKGPTGGYIFAGTATDKQPFSLTSTGIAYQGNSGSINVEASPTDSLTINADAQALFTSMYKTLDELKSNLEGGSSASISDISIKAVQDSLAQLSATRGEVGTRTKSIQSYQDDHTRRTQELTSSISNIEDVDLSQAITDYKSAETAYQASLQVVSQGFGLSLLNYLK